jgi:hypothetical protein
MTKSNYYANLKKPFEIKTTSFNVIFYFCATLASRQRQYCSITGFIIQHAQFRAKEFYNQSSKMRLEMQSLISES